MQGMAGLRADFSSHVFWLTSPGINWEDSREDRLLQQRLLGVKNITRPKAGRERGFITRGDIFIRNSRLHRVWVIQVDFYRSKTEVKFAYF